MKYRNNKITVGGETFDSKKEYRRWVELRGLEDAKRILDLRRQVKFLLIPAQREESTETYLRGAHKGDKKPGKLIENECSYIADFVYTDSKTGELIVEDTKGFKTKDYIIKRKLMLYIHKIRIKEI